MTTPGFVGSKSRTLDSVKTNRVETNEAVVDNEIATLSVNHLEVTEAIISTQIQGQGLGQIVTFSLSGNQTTVDNTLTLMTWDVVGGTADLAASWSVDTWTATASQAGVYFITLNIVFAGDAAGDRRGAILYNGAGHGSFFMPLTGSAEFCGLECATCITIATGDTIKFQVFQHSGGPLDIRSAESRATMARLT